MRRRHFCRFVVGGVPIGIAGCSTDGERTPTAEPDRSPRDTEASPTPTPEPASPTPTAASSTPDAVHQPGESFTGPLDGVGWTATKPRTADSLDGTSADGVFIVVHLSAEMLLNESATISADIIRLVDDTGTAHPVDDAGMDAVDDPFEFTEVQPGTGTAGNLVFDVPSSATGLRLRIGNSTVHYVDLGLDDQ